jgi:hypothetical protein
MRLFSAFSKIEVCVEHTLGKSGDFFSSGNWGWGKIKSLLSGDPGVFWGFSKTDYFPLFIVIIDVLWLF